MTRGGIFVLCIVIYGKTRVICNHWFIDVRTNKIFEERAVFLYLIDAGVRGTFFTQEICAVFVERIILFL